MLCKVFLRRSPVKKAVVVDSCEGLVKKGNYYYIILFLSRFSTHMFPRAGKYFPGEGAIFSVSQTANSNSPLWPGLGGGGYFDWCIIINKPSEDVIPSRFHCVANVQSLLYIQLI